MQFNKENLFLAFNFAYDRQSVYRNKEILGMEAPWTTDPILQENQFCNIRRADDKVSRIIIKNICHNDNLSPEDKILNLVMARMCNHPSMFVGDAFGINTIDNFNKDEVVQRTTELQAQLKSENSTLFRQIYRIVPPKGSTKCMFIGDKMQRVVDAVKSGKLSADILLKATDPNASIQQANYLMGTFNKPSFVFCQMYLDMSWAGVVPFDGNDFLRVGEGSVKGGQIIHGLPQNDKNPDRDGAPLIRHLHSVQQQGWKALEDRTGKVWMDVYGDDYDPLYKNDYYGQLSLMDVQNWMCEYRKMWNIRDNGGLGGKKYKGKDR